MKFLKFFQGSAFKKFLKYHNFCEKCIFFEIYIICLKLIYFFTYIHILYIISIKFLLSYLGYIYSLPKKYNVFYYIKFYFFD